MSLKPAKRFRDRTSKPEKGGGPRRVEIGGSRSVDDMYKRLLATGELQNAMQVKANNTHGDAERARALMNNAKVAPRYMTNEDVRKTVETVKNAEDILQKKQKKAKSDYKLKVEVDKRIAEIEAKHAEVKNDGEG